VLGWKFWLTMMVSGTFDRAGEDGEERVEVMSSRWVEELLLIVNAFLYRAGCLPSDVGDVGLRAFLPSLTMSNPCGRGSLPVCDVL